MEFNRTQNKDSLYTAASSEARAKLCEWAILAGKGWLLLSGSVAQASLKTDVKLSLSQTEMIKIYTCGGAVRSIDCNSCCCCPVIPQILHDQVL